MRPIKVLVVDDSPVFRALLSEIIEADPDLSVVGCAEDPYQARTMIKALNPDVLTLDIEMPKMNGVQFLKNLMRLRPMPVVMISTLTQHGANATLLALELGAIDYFPKPAVDDTADLLNYKRLVNEKIKSAASAQIIQPFSSASEQRSDLSSSVTLNSANTSVPNPSDSHVDLIAIGASTGGTEAVKQLLSALPSQMPPIVITQHISGLFSAAWAARLNSASQLTVCELGQMSTQLQPNHAYVAAGDSHLCVTRKGSILYARREDSPPVNRHKPSVDVMFDSVCRNCGKKAIAVLLTGMGRDGARGMLALREAGALTIAQDEHSSVVWGMPRVAVELGAAMKVKPLHQIPRAICERLQRPSHASLERERR
ncbi:chemotaxis response regulator protein-glutamate methylesterase [Vibrio sp. SM6]|uniref:Protein-glutamate methylesterase/protein-glutamine glutaminase n=1 Tax=Vibrio agarilyticus TaxID=2726741 RepID=A0A7X8YG18_9VIBR|nr:chemotaxis response regulator protein-glutamate methylesterase [Vibrio agarilyticus]NLS11936.1 chemotaxis response regulator protein-glutamate methylesterase [Vibrio agarilyticus]